MAISKVCPECGAFWPDEQQTCQENIHQMLYWEHEKPENWAVHHLTVLCYHLQHPSLYAPEGLTMGIKLLEDFLVHGLTTEEVRRQNHASVDSGKRTWKIKATNTAQGSYEKPIGWTIRTTDVIEGGIDRYCESVHAWAKDIYEQLGKDGAKHQQ